MQRIDFEIEERKTQIKKLQDELDRVVKARDARKNEESTPYYIPNKIEAISSDITCLYDICRDLEKRYLEIKEVLKMGKRKGGCGK